MRSRGRSKSRPEWRTTGARSDARARGRGARRDREHPTHIAEQAAESQVVAAEGHGHITRRAKRRRTFGEAGGERPTAVRQAWCQPDEGRCEGGGARVVRASDGGRRRATGAGGASPTLQRSRREGRGQTVLATGTRAVPACHLAGGSLSAAEFRRRWQSTVYTHTDGAEWDSRPRTVTHSRTERAWRTSSARSMVHALPALMKVRMHLAGSARP